MTSRSKTEKLPPLRHDSRAFKVLSAIANGTINTVLEMGKVAAIPRSSIARLAWKPNVEYPPVEINLEKIVNDARERYRYRQAVKDLRERRFARIVKQDGKQMLEITELGNRRLRSVALQDVGVSVPKTWDGLWRIALFDIPEDSKDSRDIFRGHLNRLGFFALQKSTFVLPWPCEDELDVLIKQLQIEECVTFFKTDSLGYQEPKALHRFNLRRRV